jgi:hypothetical protein
MNLKVITRMLLASAAGMTLIAGCATNQQGQLVFDPNQVNVALSSALTPQPQVIEEVYEPAPSDVYVADVAERDVVVYRGDTYIWVTDSHGARHRQFYAHGDHRADVFHRRDELHRVMTNHGGRLPDHPIGGDRRAGPEHVTGGHPQGRPGDSGPAMAGRGQPPAGGHPGAMPAPHTAVAAKPVPPAKDSKDKKKS